MEEELAELRQQIADLAELTVTMRHRANLPQYRQEWNDDRDVEERLVARIERWVQSSRELLGAGPRDEYQSVVEAARGRPRPDPVHSPRSRG
jgi:hypothetical protein